MNKNYDPYKKTILFFFSLISVALMATVFAYFWYLVYWDTMYFFHFYRKGNWALIGLYAILVYFFSTMYGALRIGQLRRMEVVLSQFLATFLANIVMYFVICLLAFGLVNPGYMILMQLIDCVIAVVWTVVTRRLYNRIFQPQKLKDELQANFDVLLTQYPSGMRVNALLAAKNFAVRPEHIVVGNGAAELIKEVMEQIGGNCGFIRPTFEEYPNRFPTERSVIFVPQTEDFSYTAEDVIAYFTAHPISCLVMINPDNPTGNYLDHGERMKLLTWCDREQITLIWDESFSDFADEPDNQMLTEELLGQYSKLIVVKSISKSYGVPGLRLGVLASGNETLIADLKKRAVIWNINSFAEYYMQIAQKYKKDYVAAMEKFREERAWLAGELEQIAHMRVYPTQANYFMVELLDGRRSGDVVRELLVHEQILLKDLTGKIKCGDRQFLRIAIRNRVENERMVRALENILK